MQNGGADACGGLTRPVNCRVLCGVIAFTLPVFSAGEWILLGIGAFAIGLAKTGVPGLGILFVAIFANVLPARESTGVVLPMLILGDIFAATSYRKNLVWSHLWRLSPWAAAGILAGWFALGSLSDAWTARAIGLILLAMLIFHFVRKRQAIAAPSAAPRASPATAAAAGLLAGFSTLVANAAGPVMTVYLLAMRLPKLEFLGTGAVFFLLINWFKVPFMVNLGLINGPSLVLNLWLAPIVIAGALVGRVVARRIAQQSFENIALALAGLAALRLLTA